MWAWPSVIDAERAIKRGEPIRWCRALPTVHYPNAHICQRDVSISQAATHEAWREIWNSVFILIKFAIYHGNGSKCSKSYVGTSAFICRSDLGHTFFLKEISVHLLLPEMPLAFIEHDPMPQ